MFSYTGWLILLWNYKSNISLRLGEDQVLQVCLWISVSRITKLPCYCTCRHQYWIQSVSKLICLNGSSSGRFSAVWPPKTVPSDEESQPNCWAMSHGCSSDVSLIPKQTQQLPCAIYIDPSTVDLYVITMLPVWSDPPLMRVRMTSTEVILMMWWGTLGVINRQLRGCVLERHPALATLLSHLKSCNNDLTVTKLQMKRLWLPWLLDVALLHEHVKSKSLLGKHEHYFLLINYSPFKNYILGKSPL